MSTHVVIANATGVKEIAITDEEGETFLKACENVARHYSVTTTQKTLDWLALAGAGLQIYGTRLAVLFADKEKPARVDRMPSARMASGAVQGGEVKDAVPLHIVPAPEDNTH